MKLWCDRRKRKKLATMRATLQELQIVPNVARLLIISAQNSEAAAQLPQLPVAAKQALKPPSPVYPGLETSHGTTDPRAE